MTPASWKLMDGLLTGESSVFETSSPQTLLGAYMGAFHVISQLRIKSLWRVLMICSLLFLGYAPLQSDNLLLVGWLGACVITAAMLCLNTVKVIIAAHVMEDALLQQYPALLACLEKHTGE